MAETETHDFRPNVQKGAAWLEEQGAWDWPDKILAAVAQAQFDMAECDQCAVGVTLGDYAELMDDGKFDANEARAMGFEQPMAESLNTAQIHADYRALEAEWITYATEEQAARKAAQ